MGKQVDPKPKVIRKVRTGTGNTLKRTHKGTEVDQRGSAVINQETLAEDRAFMADKGDKQFSGNAAPRNGGQAQAASSPGLSGSAKKSTVRRNVSNIKRSAASPIAKRSAIKIRRRGQ